VRPTSLDAVPSILHNAYRASFYGRPSTAFVDLPADLIKAELQSPASPTSLVPSPPPSQTSEAQIFKVSHLIRSAKAPLIVIGKGAAYARAEHEIRALVDATKIPFLPTPMGKGVVPDSHPLNTASARSSALQHADVVLLLGARLNWILHFGDAPKWNNAPTFVQVDIEPLEIGRNASSASHGLVGDLRLITQQLTRALASPQWSYSPPPSSPYLDAVAHSTKKNIASAHTKASRPTAPGSALSFQRAFELIKTTLHDLSPPDDGRIVYISEGANTMDISRSAFPVEHPRLRLDAGTYATMGVGPGYAIAAHAAYNFSGGAGPTSADGADQARKKIVCFEGDSAFGFSAMEVETMARYGMDVLIFVMNNGGVYHGDADDAGRWGEMRANTVRGREGGLRSTSLGWEVGYEKVAEMCGGFGTVARTEEELREATRRGFEEGRVAVVNVMVESGKEGKLEFGWQASAKKGGKTGEAKL
jgi:2-hydroxyacyl-CoA lyase 1